MPNSRKRTKNAHYKQRYKSYRTNEVREKNKAKRVIADCNRSSNPTKTLKKLLPQLNEKVRHYAKKYE